VMNPFLRLIALVAIIMVGMGCVSTRMANVSPESTIPTVLDFKTIDATIKVTCSDPLSSANEDVAAALDKEEVFRSVMVFSSKDTLSESGLELFVLPEIIEEDYYREEMGKAVLRGLTLGLADKAFADKYEYTVTLKATLKRGSKVFATYEATGKYYAEQPENRKKAQASEARELAWEHALKLLVAKIKKDRENIVNCLNGNK